MMLGLLQAAPGVRVYASEEADQELAELEEFFYETQNVVYSALYVPEERVIRVICDESDMAGFECYVRHNDDLQFTFEGYSECSGQTVYQLDGSGTKENIISETDEGTCIVYSDGTVLNMALDADDVRIDINRSYNLVAIKTGVHKHLHSSFYYKAVNLIICSTYRQGSSLNKKNVLSELGHIRAYLMALSNAAPF